MLQVAVCDDETYFRNEISAHLKALDLAESLDIVGYSNGKNLLTDCRNGKAFDIIFLDVEMPSENGILIAHSIRDIDKQVFIVFVSSHENYVFSAFSVSAFGYLLKPLAKEDLKKKMDEILDIYHQTHSIYTLKDKKSQFAINIDKIRYLEVINHTLFVYTDTENFSCKRKLEEEAQKLIPYGFIQPHRSFLVNPKYIKGISGLTIITNQNEEIPISRKNASQVLERYQKYLIGCKI